MIAILSWIVSFLAAVGPVIIAAFAEVAAIATALWEIVALFAAVVAIIGLLELIFDPKGKEKVGNFLANVVGGGLGVVSALVTTLSPQLATVGTDIKNALVSSGGPLLTSLSGDFQGFAATLLNTHRGVFASLGESTPANAIDTAALALTTAFGAGLASHAVTLGFEALLPEKLNTFNAFGPAIAELAGFAEVTGEVLGPLYKNAFGKSAEYFYRGKYKPEYPDETDAVLWHARGLLDDTQLDEIFQVSGLKQKYEPAFLTSAYHSISPFVMIRLLEAGVFDVATAKDELTFAGIRPKSQQRMIDGAAYLVADPYRKQVVASLETEYANGLIDDADLQSLAAGTRHTNDIDKLTLQRAQLQRHIKLSGELEAAYLALGLTGLIDEQAYAALLAGLPMTQDAINAKVAVLDARLKANTQKKLLAAEATLERQTLAVERRTAMRNYASGIIDEWALAVALIATGLTAVQVAAWVDLAVLQKKGTIRFVYGLEKTPADAQLLRERVASLLDQRKKMLIDDAGFTAQLQALGIPADVQNALLSGAAALTTPASARELVLVRTG